MKITNQEVPRRVQLKKAYRDTRNKNIGYFGHVIRDSTLQHAFLEGKIYDRRIRTVWMGNTTEWSEFSYVEATRKAQDRNYWRQLIASDPAMDGTWRRWASEGVTAFGVQWQYQW